MSHLLGGGVQRVGYGGCQTIPTLRLFPQTTAAGRGQRIELCAPVVVALAPFSSNQFLSLQAVERGVQRTLRYVERIARNLADPEQHSVPMQGFQRDSLQDQHVQCAGEQVCVLAHEWPPSLTRSISEALLV